VIYNGVERARYRPRPRDESRRRLGIETEAPTVVFVGNLKPVKGLEFLLAAFATLREKTTGARLHLIGRGPLEADLRKTVIDAGLDDAVRLEGEQSPAEVARWMSAADLVCLPSVNEGVPNVLLEAMACGTPVVASDVGGIPEIVDPGACGYLVAPGDPRELADALERALGREWDREQIRRRTDRFTWERNAALLLGVLSNAAETRG
jgi:glycosyltransferase involved in cell wall biosynthesis